MTDLAPLPLLTPFRMGELLLPNRIVMAPLTPQRASAGIIISEGTAISPEGYR